MQRGFTLVELVMVMAVVGVLSTVVVPNFGPFVQSGRMDATQNRLIASLSLARSEAIRRGVNVQVCARSSEENMQNYSCGNNWSSGWAVVAAGEVVRVEEAPSSQLSLVAGNLEFESSGQLTSANDLCFTIDDQDSSTERRYLHLNQFGRIRAWDGTQYAGVCGES